jgi:antitoxin MazE
MNAFTKFSMWGNSLAIRIPSGLAREARLFDGANAELSVVDGKLVISPIDAPPSYDINDLIAAMTDENRHVEIDAGPAQGDEFA